MKTTASAFSLLYLKVLVTGNVVEAVPIVDTGTAEGRLAGRWQPHQAAARQPWRCKACGHGGALVHKWWNPEITSLIIWLLTVWTWHQSRLGDFQAYNKFTSTWVRMEWMTVEWQAGSTHSKTMLPGKFAFVVCLCLPGIGWTPAALSSVPSHHSLKMHIMTSY